MSKRFSFRLRSLHLLVALMVILPGLAGTVGTVAASSGAQGAVYTMTNSASGNAIQEYERAADGTLTPGGSFATGGLGTGAGLGSQGAIILSANGRWLFAVNAGSNEISVFAVRPGQLVLVHKVSSAGSDPVSLTLHNNLLYVLNAGNGGSIAGFRVSNKGHLSYIHGSTRFLSNNGVGSAASPEEIGFTPDGRHLVVSEKGSNLIDTYEVEDGRAQGPSVNPSNGPAPYGFGFSSHNVLVISEAAHSAVSSYKVAGDGLKSISASILDTQAAACWLVVSGNGHYAYAANAASGTVSAYKVAADGSLTLLDSGITATIGSGTHPIDMDFSVGYHFLYVLASGNNTINAFKVQGDGSLSPIGTVSSPAGAESGLAAR